MIYYVIIGVIVFGLFVFLITGLGILTKKIFDITRGTTQIIVAGTPAVPATPGQKNAGLKTYIENSKIYTAEQKKAEIEALPLEGAKPEVPATPATSKDVPDEQNVIDLSGDNLTVVKITLIAIWIIMVIFFLFGTYKMLFAF